MPREPPVMSAVFPSNLLDILSFLDHFSCRRR
jgi:hypothetical protein